MSNDAELFTIKRGDLEPALSASLKNHAGAALDLSGAASVTFRFRPRSGGALRSGAATVVSATLGTVAYQWQAGDTDIVGKHDGEFVVDWAGRPQTIPSGGYTSFVVVATVDAS